MTTVAASGVVIVSIALFKKPQPSPFVARSSENLTSADVIGVPSLNLTSVRSLIVQVNLSAACEELFASHGETVLPSWLIM